MNLRDIAHTRLHNQFLLKPLAKPQDVVRKFGAMQGQEFAPAKWAIGMRSKGATDESITKLYNDGKILRTHILRPTWHFVAPEDIRWIQSLTAPRVHAFNKYYYKQLDLDEATLRKGAQVLAAALKGGKQLIRKEVAEVFKDAGIDADSMRLGYLIMYAELEAVVCSGAMRGKQHTLAQLSERAPQAEDLPKAQALTELTTRFFTAHGPATIEDFRWWSSLTVADIKAGIELAGLSKVDVEGKAFYYAKKTRPNIPSPLIHLLPIYDEYGIAYKERRPSSQAHLDKKPAGDDLFYHLMILDGQLVGGWKRTITKGEFLVQLNPFIQLEEESLHEALEAARAKLESFVQLPVTLQY